MDRGVPPSAGLLVGSFLLRGKGVLLVALGGALPLFSTSPAPGPEEGASPGGDALGT